MRISYLWSKFFKKARLAAIRNSTVHATSSIESGSHFVDSSMDRYSYCGYDCDITACDIGSFCSIASDVCVGGGIHPMDWVAMSPVFSDGSGLKKKFATHKRPPIERTTIKNDVWIGQRVLIAQGITIGNGAVIGMGSVVTRDVPDYAIVGGTPAKLIRKRFDDSTCERLLASQWWTFSDEQLAQYASVFNDVPAFLDQIENS